MKRGPKPTNKKILKLRGSWRADLPDDRLAVKATRPICPDWLNELGKKIWHRYSRNLFKIGRLCKENEVMFAHFCDSQAEFIIASVKLEELRKGNANDKDLLSWSKHKERCRATVIKRANSFGLAPENIKIILPLKPKKKTSDEQDKAQQWLEQQKGA